MGRCGILRVSYQLDQAIVEERKIFGEDMIVYEFWNVSKFRSERFGIGSIML